MKYILATLVLLLVFSPVPASACSCAPPGSVAEEKAQSTRVFLGRVTATEERTPQMDKGWLVVVSRWIKELFGVASPPTDRDYQHKLISFTVLQTFKGTPVNRLQVATGMGGGDCGYFFDLNKDYVVYAHGEENSLGTGICSLTGPASDPKSGLAALRNGS